MMTDATTSLRVGRWTDPLSLRGTMQQIAVSTTMACATWVAGLWLQVATARLAREPVNARTTTSPLRALRAPRRANGSPPHPVRGPFSGTVAPKWVNWAGRFCCHGYHGTPISAFGRFSWVGRVSTPMERHIWLVWLAKLCRGHFFFWPLEGKLVCSFLERQPPYVPIKMCGQTPRERATRTGAARALRITIENGNKNVAVWWPAT